MYAYRGVDLVIGVMGILKCGATFNVLDPAYPPERQNIYLSVAKPAAILNLKRAGELLPPVREYIQNELDIKCELSGLELLDDGTLVHEENNEQKPLLLTNEDVNVEVGPDSVATLSFTSGSTGIPKGVRGRHYSLTHFYPWMAEKFGLSERDRFTMLSGIAHDPIQRDIFTPLFLGSELRIPHPDIITTPGQLAEWMRDNEVTTSHLTPAMGQLLSANAQVEIPSLFNIFFVGDILTKRDCLRLQQFAPNVRIINMYGTTETQRAVSYYLIPAKSTHPSFLTSVKDVLPAGQGMVDVQLLVVSRMTDKDGKRRMCGVGEAGEIYVRSGGLSEGYLRLGDVTNEKFQTNWFSTGSPQNDQKMPFYLGARDRMYKSGDLGRYLPDGTVECVGRADDQVKIRGFRIELGEIDTHLSQHPRVRENVTLVKRDRNEEQTLISYFVPNELDDVEAEETSTDEADEDGPPRRYTRLIRNLRNYLKQKLPAYSVPALIVPLRKLPLTPNGKIDKNALPFPDTAEYLSKYQSKPANENLTSTQKAVHQVWAQVLNIKSSIDLEDNFFDLGGHSILATRLLFQIRQALAVNVSLGLVFNHPTIEKMSAEIDKIKNVDLNLVTNTPISTPELRKLTLEPETSDEEIFNYNGEFEKISQSAPWSSWTPETAPKLRVPNTENPVYFLTGATGFLGSFILARLLQRYPNSTVYCLARGQSNEKAYERIKTTLESNVLWQSGFESRIIGVQGDLAQPQLGVSDSMWEELKTKVDSVIHNGALVHWVFPYSKLRDPNVNGTLEALKLSVSNPGEMKGFHFVSSTSVLDTEHYVRLSELNLSSKSPVHLGVPENDDLLGSQHGLRSGYGQTKWVCEKLVMDAHSKGAHATIIRPGYIVGDCQTGVSITDDFLWRLIKGCIQIGKVPSMTNRVNMCSVDYVADVVIGAAANPIISVPKGVFHVSNPHPFQFNQFFDFLSQYGYSVQTEDYVTWRDILMDVTLSDQDNALYPLLHFVLDDLPTSTKSPELDQTNCAQLIKEWNAGVECKPMQDLIPLYLSYLVHVGFLSQPQDSTKNQLPALPEGLKSVLTSTGRGGRS
jgi:L-aminoadipate-semialdehyde dehydrogenase